jgi:outer membrane protein insertion porin family
VIRSELIVDEGDPFSTLLVNKSVNKIKGRNIFGKVVAQTLPGSKNDLKILELSVEEKATGEIMAGAGVGTEGTSFTFAVAENNWLGKGINLKTSLNASPNKLSGALAITDPNYKFTGNQVNGTIAVSATDQKENSGYESSRTGASLGTAFEQYENIFLSPKIMASYEDIEVTSKSNKSIKKMAGTFTNIDFLYGISLDKRNQAFQPSKGYILGFQQALPVIQDSSSIMNMFNVSKYHEFSDDVIGSLKFSLKSMHGIDDDVRITNRLFIPTRKLRGFNTAKVGPKDGTDYIGGNYVSTASAEAQLPNLLPESYRTDFSVFMDAGNVWEVDYSDTIDDTNKIRSAVGVSANVYTTIGPLSFTLAQHVTKATNDETETFNFRLGTSF